MTAGNTRKIAGVYGPPPVHWVGDGFRVRGYFTGRDLALKLSPFVLLDYGEPHVFAATDELRRGVGPHPHRGFETVTIAFEGSVAHHDSTGAGGVIGPGDVQWMTAGSGILHREYHDAAFAGRGGSMHMAQIWVNLPRAHKMVAPGYQAIVSEQMAVVRLPDDAGQVRVIAGEYQGRRGPARTFTPINLFDIRLANRKHVDLAIPGQHNAAILVMKGSVAIDDTRAGTNDLVLFAHEGERIRLTAEADAHVLLLSGQPIDEPIVQYGPFVMNSEEEIEQAIMDFRSGKFGHLDA